MRAFVVTLAVVTLGLFDVLVLLDLINILTVTHAPAHGAGEVFLRVGLAGAGVALIVGVLLRSRSSQPSHHRKVLIPGSRNRRIGNDEDPV